MTAPDALSPLTSTWPVHWRAHLMWYWQPPPVSLFTAPPLPEEHRDAFVLMRREVVLDAAPSSAPCRVTADGRYTLRVNGVEVSRGPVRSEPGVLQWDEVDIAPQLRAGANVLAITARYYGAATPWWRPAAPFSDLGRGGVALEVEPLPELDSGPAWRVRRGPWAARPPLVFGAPNEDVDTRGIPAGWELPGFDDSSWDHAVQLGSALAWGATGDGLPATPFTVVEPRDIPASTADVIPARPLHRAVTSGDFAEPLRQVTVDPMFATGALATVTEGDPTLPVSLEAGESVVVELGGMVIGTPRVTVDAAAGVAVVLRSGEALRDGAVYDGFRFWAHRRTCAGGTEVIEPFESAGMRYLSVTAEGPARVLGIELVERRYPFSRDGSFASGDESLDGTWRLGVRTLELCSTDAFLDCPGREQRAWLGDFYVHCMVTYATSADTRLVARALRLGARTLRVDGTLGMIAAGDFSGHALTLPDYSLHWIRALARYWEHTGDLGLVEELLPVAELILRWFTRYVDAGVLGRVPGWVFLDWWPLLGEWPLATLQGLLALAATDHAVLCDVVGHARAASRSRALASELRDGFARFLAPDGRVLDEVETGTATQAAAAMAVLCGAVEGARAREVLTAVMDDDAVRYPVEAPAAIHNWDFPADWDPARHVLAAQPFFCHWVHQALAAAGHHDLLVRSIRRWEPFLSTGDGCIAEFWPGHSVRGSHAHAWSATPTYDLSAHLLGVRPGSPGYTTVVVAPRFAGLRELRGTVPTARGNVLVDLVRDGDHVSGHVELPPGTRGTFIRAPGAAAQELAPGRTQVG